MILSKERLCVLMPFSKLIERLDEFLALNLNSEIYIDSEIIDNYSLRDIELINNRFEKCSLAKRIHGPFSDLNPGSADKRIREISMERFLGAIELSFKLKADSLTLHSHFEPIFYRRHFEEWLNNSKDIWERLSHEAKKRKVSIHIENSIDDSPRAVLELLKTHPYLGGCFDAGHYNVFNPRGWKDALREYPKGSIKEVHLSDNNGDEDSHLSLGEGSIDFKGLFEEIGRRNENPVFTLEPHTQDGLIKSLEFIKRYMD